MGSPFVEIAVACRLALGPLAGPGPGPSGANAPEAAAPEHFRLVSVAPGSWAAIAIDGDRTTVGNAGFVIGSTGVLVVDTLGTTEGANELLSVIRSMTPLPVRWVVNTHRDLDRDHASGNAVFQKAGAVVVGREGVGPGARTDNRTAHRKSVAGDHATREALVLPDVATDESGRITLSLGDRDAFVLPRPGHTGGDRIVHVAAGDVVYTGDLFWKSNVPNLVDADTSAWIATLDGFLSDFPSASFVPGHGEVGHALDVRFFEDYLTALRQVVSREIEAGAAGPPLVDAVVAAMRPRYGAWTGFSRFAAPGAAETERQMRDTRSAATPVREKEKR